jgi:hypothetical protein
MDPGMTTPVINASNAMLARMSRAGDSADIAMGHNEVIAWVETIDLVSLD